MNGKESGLRRASRGPRPPERCGPRRRSGALLLTGQATAGARPSTDCFSGQEDLCEASALSSSTLDARSAPRPRSQASRRLREAPMDRNSSVSSLRPEFFCSWLRRSDGFVQL
eukprot:s5039_g1.t1